VLVAFKPFNAAKVAKYFLQRYMVADKNLLVSIIICFVEFTGKGKTMRMLDERSFGCVKVKLSSWSCLVCMFSSFLPFFLLRNCGTSSVTLSSAFYSLYSIPTTSILTSRQYACSRTQCTAHRAIAHRSRWGVSNDC